ncbi:hypothetical protein GCM10009634_30460 [Saccharothrix xinjiangensis]
MCAADAVGGRVAVATATAAVVVGATVVTSVPLVGAVADVPETSTAVVVVVVAAEVPERSTVVVGAVVVPWHGGSPRSQHPPADATPGAARSPKPKHATTAKRRLINISRISRLLRTA